MILKGEPASPKTGLTLIEILIVISLLGVIILFTGGGYLFKAQEKNILFAQTEKITDDIKIAQQNSINATEGKEYGIDFIPDDMKYTFTARDQDPVHLPEEIKVMKVNGNDFSKEITFEKLTGKPSEAATITLETKRFKSKINIEEEGSINYTKPEPK
jgi:prepilin-type N-terminal cleavage/methylation domain-containing protein